MTLADLVSAVLEMPPGSIVYAKRTDDADDKTKAEFDIKEVNGKKVTDEN
jgi:hypothetical protein